MSESQSAPLEKPLGQLTEEDIAQLTREDCRRYLKDKGMRRPSWNKSQAIQQVIMLKSLLETTPDSDAAGSSKRLRVISRPHDDNAAAAAMVPKGASDDGGNSVSAEETAPYLGKDLDRPDSSGGLSGRFATVVDEAAKLRTTVPISTPVGQMTIFYCGKVNVYDDMPADKARAIINIAESPLLSPEEQLVDSTTFRQPLSYLSKAGGSTKARSDSAPVILPAFQTVTKKSNNSRVVGEENDMLREETPLEGPSTRKASVQRYLEKRKDRFKSKRKAGMISCASLDMYYNHQMGNQMPIIDKYSPPQIGPSTTPSRCSSVDNDSVKNICLSTGLSNKGL